MSNLTTIKQTFYKFRNKVDLTNRETFGFFPSVNKEPINNELYVYLNRDLYYYKEGEITPNNFKPVSITDHNLEINNIIAKEYYQYLLPDLRTNNAYDRHIFYDTSLFEGTQPELTTYFEYRGDIFEYFERLNQIERPKIDREQEVKEKHIDWFETKFIAGGINRISKYIFNPLLYANEWDRVYDKGKYLVSTPNDYFRIETNVDIPDDNLYLTSRSNSIRPARIYYKKITTHTDTNKYEHKFLYPYYLGGPLNEYKVGENILNIDVTIETHKKAKKPL